MPGCTAAASGADPAPRERLRVGKDCLAERDKVVAMLERNSRKPFSALQRFARRPLEAAQTTQQAVQRAVQEQCELCGEPIPPEHRHLAEVSRREIKCVCQACSILFSRREASIGRYCLVPDGYVD